VSALHQALLAALPAADLAPTTTLVTVQTEVSSHGGIHDPAVRPLIVALVALAGFLVLVTVWYWWATRPTPDALDRLRKPRRWARSSS
jgi:hypothetical protein